MDTKPEFTPIVVDPSTPLVPFVSQRISTELSWAREPEFGALTRERQLRLERYALEAKFK